MEKSEVEKICLDDGPLSRSRVIMTSLNFYTNIINIKKVIQKVLGQF